MRDTGACRACLNTEGKLEKIPDSWYRLFESLTGTQITKSDGYPDYFCVECKSHMNKAITFRKKSRRAFFVLKEIMLVKKEVNLSDILTVNRSTANLKSGLGIWNPQQSSSFSLLTTIPGGTQVLVNHGWDVVTSNVVIDVEGEGADPQPPEEGLPHPDTEEPKPDVRELDENDNMDNQEHDDKEQNLEDSREPHSDIDMEDIFKGLQEPESDTESDKDLGKVVKKKKRMIKRKIVEDQISVVVSGTAKCLTYFDIKKLTDEQQKEGYEIRLQDPEFKKALYTCRVCVESFPEYFLLQKHFTLHMDRNKSNIICQVCEDKCLNEDHLTIHISENHLYKYTCQICQKELYALKDVLSHRSAHSGPEPTESTLMEAELSENFLFIPVPDEDKKENFKRLSCSGKYACDECGMSFPTKKMLSAHVALHETAHLTKRNTKCPVCELRRPNNKTLQTHMEMYHNYTYHCKLCSYEAQNTILADYHLKRVHKIATFKCRYCRANLASQLCLNAHERAQHAEHALPCAACGRGFRGRSTLYSHQFRQHSVLHLAEPPTGDGPNACKHCNVQFLSEKAYSNHLLQAGHEEAKDLPFKCLACKTLYNSEEESKEHAGICPLIKFPGPCRLCGVVVNSHRDYFKHCKASHPNYTSIVNSKRKLCDSCGKTYSFHCTCKTHPNGSKRTSLNKYKCASCQIEFKKGEQVMYHVIYAHMEKPFICTICSKAFRRRGQCKDHILKVHAPVKPYECPICERQFSHLDFLRSHAKKVHEVKIGLETRSEKHKRRFYLYPNMKVDLSLVDTRIINSVKVQVADYTNQIFENIPNYRDYIITNEDVTASDGIKCEIVS